MAVKGRPSRYNAKIADEICSRLAAGETLRAICRSEGMPSHPTVLGWVASDAAFADRYARARGSGLEVIAEEIIEISDDGTNDWMDTNDPENPGYRFNGEHAQRSRLRVDARKWLLSKLRPDKYGDRVAQEISGKDGGAIQSEHRITFVKAPKAE